MCMLLVPLLVDWWVDGDTEESSEWVGVGGRVQGEGEGEGQYIMSNGDYIKMQQSTATAIALGIGQHWADIPVLAALNWDIIRVRVWWQMHTDWWCCGGGGGGGDGGCGCGGAKGFEWTLEDLCRFEGVCNGSWWSRSRSNSRRVPLCEDRGGWTHPGPLSDGDSAGWECIGNGKEGHYKTLPSGIPSPAICIHFGDHAVRQIKYWLLSPKLEDFLWKYPKKSL